MVSTHQDHFGSSSPPTMDSSPLTLLAQTCDAIGLPDATPTKSTLGKSSKIDSTPKNSSKDDPKPRSSSKTSIMADSTSETNSNDRRSSSSSNSDCKKNEHRSKHSRDPKVLTATDSRSGSKCNVVNLNPLAFSPALFPPFLQPTPAMASPYQFGTPLTTGPCFPSFPSVVSGGWLPPAPSPAFQPKCSEPFCKTCPAIAAAAIRAAAPCGNVGCPCGGVGAHGDLSSFWLSYGSFLGLHGSPNPAAANPLLAAAAASAYAVSATSSAAHQQHTCSWVTGNEFCGRRFNSSEELLQHLRTHTTQESTKLQLSTTPAASSSASPKTPSYLSSLRFHPYHSGNRILPSSPSTAAAAAALASLQFPPAPFAQQTLCNSLASQKLPGSLQQP